MQVSEKMMYKDQKLNILILQTATVAVIMLFAVGIRIFGGDVYGKLSRMFHERFDDITLTSEVIDPTDRKGEESASEEAEENDGVLSDEEYDSELDEGIEGNITEEPGEYNGAQSSAVAGRVNCFMWPVNGRVTSHYGGRIHPITGKYTVHNGLDIAADTGTEIAAAFDGTVTAAGYSESYGYYIMLAHGDSVKTLYAHCSKLLLSEGDSVKKGDTLALVGSTGRSTGPHVHFEVRVGSYRVDPEWLLSDVVEV